MWSLAVCVSKLLGYPGKAISGRGKKQAVLFFRPLFRGDVGAKFEGSGSFWVGGRGCCLWRDRFRGNLGKGLLGDLSPSNLPSPLAQICHRCLLLRGRLVWWIKLVLRIGEAKYCPSNLLPGEFDCWKPPHLHQSDEGP